MKKIILFMVLGYCFPVFCMDLILTDFPLHHAASKGKHKKIKELLAQGANANAVGYNGNTPLHLVSTVDAAQLLLNAKASVNAKNMQGETPLHTALFGVRFGCANTPQQNKMIAQELLRYGADVNAVNSEHNNLLHDAVTYDNCWAADFLLSKGIDRTQPNQQNLTAFELLIKKYAAQYDVRDMLNVFESYGMAFFPDVRLYELLKIPEWIRSNSFDFKNQMHVSKINNLARLFGCADRGMRDSKNTTIGITFSQDGSIVRHVSHKDLEYYLGADNKIIVWRKICWLQNYILNCVAGGEAGDLVEKFLPMLRWDFHIAQALMVQVIQMKNSTLLKKLLEQGICARHCANNLEYEAIRDDNPEALRVLADQGYLDYVQQDKDGQTLLQYARVHGKKASAAMLERLIFHECYRKILWNDHNACKKLLSQGINCNNGWFDGLPLLYYSFSSGKYRSIIKFISLLLAHGADINAVDREGRTILQYAMLLTCSRSVQERNSIFQILLQAGAPVNRVGSIDTSLLQEALTKGCFSLANLFLEYGAIVTQKMIMNNYFGISLELKDALQKKYDDQKNH